ncbi:MAG: hypothetical protein JSV03_12690 [Planctomycetota bacterium]|nr:MAG: hypothetical protein JSV03_12690 [Planctomycetota bacterium]
MPKNEQVTGTRGTLARFARMVLTHRYLPIFVALLAIVLTLPSLRAGWIGDDDWQRLKIMGSQNFKEFFGSPTDLFCFLDGDPEHIRRGMDIGLAPWWTYENVKGAFWRPVTVLTHRLDYWFWPKSSRLMHLHSILWFGALVMAVAYLYHRLMGITWVAGLAALMWAIDDAHGMPVGFLANRNALLATFFGICALIFHDRWRSPGAESWWAGAVMGPFFLALSLLSAEAGIGICAYLAAHAIFLDRGTWRQRCLVLLPYASVLVAWRLVWTQLGYGTTNLGLYVDPINEPLRFVATLIERAPLYFWGQWAMPIVEIGNLLGPTAKKLLWLVALLFLLLLAAMLIPMLRRDRRARFWAMGMVLSVIPICAVFPADRLLFFVGIGAMALLAQFLNMVFCEPAGKSSNSLRHVVNRVFACIFILMHLIIAPIILPVRAAYPAGTKDSAEDFFAHVPLDPSIQEQDVVMINPLLPIGAGYLPIIRELNRQPVPRHTRALAPGWFSVNVHRPDKHTLIIRPEHGFIVAPLDDLVRDDRNPMYVGQRVELTGMTVEVTALTDDRRPAEAAFYFDVPLEDPSLLWLQWDDGELIPFTPPSVGETITLRPQCHYLLRWLHSK